MPSYKRRPFLLLSSEPESQFDTDCDCACAATSSTLTPSFDIGKRYQMAPGLEVIDLQSPYTLAFSPTAPFGPCVLNRESWDRLQEFMHPGATQYDIDRQFAQHHLITPVGAVPALDKLQSDELTAWMHVSNSCNLDCVYCYVNKSPHNMLPDIASTSLEGLFGVAKDNGFSRIRLKYAGGEATLNMQVLKFLSEGLHQLSQRYEMEVSELLLTNGTRIATTVLEWLVTSGASVMISLDGPSSVNDDLRRSRNGVKYFEQIVANIDSLLLPNGIKPTISVTVTSRNAESIHEIMDFILDRKLPFSLNFYRESSQSQSRSDIALEEQAIIGGMLKAYERIEHKLPTDPFFNGLLDKVQLAAHSNTCGVNHNYIVVDHRGQMAQCQMHLDRPLAPAVTSRAFLKLSKGPIQNVGVEQKEGCNTCSYRYRCTGGCPVEAFRVTGRWDIKSPHCSIYKTLIPVALKLEGLRLIKRYEGRLT